MQEAPYLIKKYSSRRLYDVAEGSFVTVQDVDRLIRRGNTIKVVDAKGKDATRAILLQILTEREEGGEPLLSNEVLHEMVRMYGNVMHGPFGEYLEEGIAAMRKQRQLWQNSMPAAFKKEAQGAFDTLLQLQSSWVNTAREVWLGQADDSPPDSVKAHDAPAKPRSKKDRR